MSATLISIVMPVHNGAGWLPQTLDSIFSQTYQGFEIILVNDASTDNLLDVLALYSDARLRVVHRSSNGGVSAARNHGIRLAHGAFIAFCDADDICQPMRLERQLAFLEANPAISLCGSAFTCFNEAGDQATIAHPLANEAIRCGLMQANCFGLSTVMARAVVMQKHMFNANLRVAEDYDLWTRIAADGLGLANLPESLVRYRLHEAQASNMHGAELDQITRKLRALYCAHLLSNSVLLLKIKLADISFETFQLAVNSINMQKLYLISDFKFMLAWMYEKLPKHSLNNFIKYIIIINSLGIKINKNYIFNIFLLSIIPYSYYNKYFNILIKLKR